MDFPPLYVAAYFYLTTVEVLKRSCGARRACATKISYYVSYLLSYFIHVSKYRVISLDLRGRGLSDKPDTGYSMEHHVADIDCVMDDIGKSFIVILVI